MTWICSQCGEKTTRFRQRCARDGHRIVEDLAGQVIGGRYRLRELIGVGGMDSAVWKAWQMGAERMVAVKILPPADDAAVKRFSRGARIAANLSHPNCLVIHDYGAAEDGKLYLVMELLNGQLLNDALNSESIPVEDTIHIADQVLQALEHAHNERAVHRDLKPDNLFLCKKNDDLFHVKILDFGIAKYIEEEFDESGDGKASEGFEDLVTEQRQVCGTPQYMAPEQVVGSRVDGRADLYALGCVLYRMLTGRLPFDGKTRYELYQKHLQEAPRPFGEVRPDLQFPERLELIVMKALAKRPPQRFQTAAEMREALATVPIERNRAKRGQKPRVALKDTSPQQSAVHTMMAPSPGDPAFEAVMSQAPLKPSFAAARAAQPAQPPTEQPTVVHGLEAMADWPPAAAADTESTSPDLLEPSQSTVPDLLEPLSPTVLPHGVWTLSRPTPHVAPPQPVIPPTASIKRPATMAAPVAPQRQPAYPAQARVPTPHPPAANAHDAAGHRSLSQVAPGARPQTGYGAQASQAPVQTPAQGSGWYGASGAQPASRNSGEYMGDAVLRHPASRSMLSHGSVVMPRSSETEPSSVSSIHDRERPRWAVAAMLGGAFLLGVGGVSLGISIFGGPADAEVAVATEPAMSPAREATARQPEAEERPAVTKEAGAEAAAAGETPTPTPTEVGVDGAAAAGDEAVVPSEEVAKPFVRYAEVLFETEPPGAQVWRGQEIIGITPFRLELLAGPHVFKLRLEGHVEESLTLDVVPVVGAGAIIKRVTLQAEAPKPVTRAPVARNTSPRAEVPVVAPEIKLPEPKPPEVVQEPPPQPDKKPPREVRLLEELEGPAPQPKPKPKPKVNLLDEDEAPAAPKPKPQIKTLDEL